MTQKLDVRHCLHPFTINHYLSKEDICRYFRVSRATLNRWIRQGHFPPPETLGNITLGWDAQVLKKQIK